MDGWRYQLRHFLAVVTHGGFTAAARAELIVRAALSTSVRNLEREPGAELFGRTGRRVILTGAGPALLPSARSVLAARRSRAGRDRRGDHAPADRRGSGAALCEHPSAGTRPDGGPCAGGRPAPATPGCRRSSAG
ncbi:LysR family transcriptional regulator [Streptomyces sp. NPDC057557]|uniref:LysR family transcriptional regulator n=1 Tax=Streptomyces sp. NPDC057557 TaxID=3346167 RepID=UPI003674D9E5